MAHCAWRRDDQRAPHVVRDGAAFAPLQTRLSRRGDEECGSASLEVRRALLCESGYAFGVVRGEAALPLVVSLDRERFAERFAKALAHALANEAVSNGWTACQTRSKIIGNASQLTVVDDLV